MKNERKSWLARLFLPLFIVSIVAISFYGCAKTPTTTNTVTIGMIGNAGSPLGLDQKRSTEIIVDMVNKNGGIKVGTNKYLINFKFYDTTGSQPGAVAAANKAVYEDKVKFLTGDLFFSDAYVPITEKNKVILNAGSTSNATVKPGLNYTFYSDGAFICSAAAVVWAYQNYPDAMKKVGFILPDNPPGHESYDLKLGPIFKALNIPAEVVYFPPEATDMSAVATKLISMNPTVVITRGGGQLGDLQVVKAIWQAGYRGMFLLGMLQLSTVLEFLPVEALDHLITETSATDNDPPLTQTAKDLIAFYTDQHGKWDPGLNPIVGEINGLLAAIQQAGNFDPDKIMSIVYNGMKFESLCGPIYTVPPPPQYGNEPDKCCDAIATFPLRMFKGGKPTVTIITPKQGLELFKVAYPNYTYNIK